MLTFDDAGSIPPELRALLPERFWRRVSFDAGCWLWTGGKFHFGHAAFWWDGRTRRASRVLWEVVYGEISDPRVFVCHRCDRPACVRPSHLFLGDSAANHQDMVDKCRQHRPIGDAHHNRKLSASDAQAIRERRAAGEAPKALAREFGVHANTIYAVLTGRNWSRAC